MAKIADKYFQTHPWKVIERGFDPNYARVSESIFTLSNENLGVRGFMDEGGNLSSLRGCYTNGVYDLEKMPRSYRGIVDKSHFMIPSADWLKTGLVLDGETLDLGKCRFRDFVRELDMRRGTLTRSFVWCTAAGSELRLCFTRFLDMLHGARAYQRITLEALNFTGPVQLTAGVSFDVIHQGRQECFWEKARTEAGERRCAVQARTAHSGQEVFAGILWDVPGACAGSTGEREASLTVELPLEQGVSVQADRRAVILFDGSGGEDLWQRGHAALEETAGVTLDAALEAQRAYWEKHWQLLDIVIESSGPDTAQAVAEEQQGIRFCNFQLTQVYNGGDVRHNIGAKGLSGEVYNGHAFWDTESCCLPFYLFTDPEVARSLLLFRYNTLPQALERAKMLDCRGACYPVATLNGDEACTLWQHASLQMQPSTAVAYGIWHYVLVTGDSGFLWQYGAEMLLQIARYLESRVGQSPKTGKYGFYGVMGPDEFHMMVNNNAYTNYMGRRTLKYAAETLDEMEREHPAEYGALRDKTGLKAEEPARWREVAENMALPMTEEGLIEQHDGYFDLPHTDVNAIPISEFPLYDHWSYDRIYRTDMIKQPDVLMILYLYNTSFSREVKETNYSFYEPRTIHESSLSPAIHSILAAELGRTEDATRFFGYATRLDLDNYNRNTGDGLHITSIAMAWANIVYGFAGLRSDCPQLRFAPVLPKRWSRLRFSLFWQGRVLDVDMRPEHTDFFLRSGPAMELQVYGKPYTLDAGGLRVRT